MPPSIADWLTTIGLSKYIDSFIDSDIDLEVLPALDEADLEKLGVTLGHRKKLLKAIEVMQASPGAAVPLTPVTVGRGDRRQLTILFCDLVGSTALSQRLDPEALSGIMRAYRRVCLEVVERYDGYVAQYLGDGVMVYFGWPHAHEDDPERAVRASLDMLSAVRALPFDLTLQARAGVATGPVVFGDASAGDSSVESLAVGETPNIAARIQALAEPDHVVVSELTHKLLGNLFECADLGVQTLKGVVQPVRAWRILSPRNVEGRFDATRERGLSRLVGRTSELALLEERWAKAKAGEGQVVLLCAEPGLGKSRLTRALRDRISDRNYAQVRYQCSPFHAGSALYPVIQHLERRAGIAPEDAPAHKLAKLRGLLTKDFESVDTVLGLFAQILSLPAADTSNDDLSPQEQKEKTVKALVDQLAGRAQQSPVLAVFEDIHWADATTLDFIAELLDRVETVPVLAVATYRPEFEPAWHGKPCVTAVTLSRLSRRESAALVNEVAGGRLPPDVITQIVQKADGVPLFAEELTKAVLESGLVDPPVPGAVVPEPRVALAIPSTLRDSLMARIDRVATLKETIQIAAVLGREFSYRLISAVSQRPAQELDHALESLVAAELLSMRGRGATATYAFSHALVQDAAYESILNPDRRQLHGRTADVLAKQLAEAEVGEPALLALHLERAGRVDQAIEWHMRAGQHERAKLANREAIYHLERALALLQPGAECREIEAELRGNLGLLHAEVSGFTSRLAKQHLDRGRELIEQGISREREVQILIASSEHSLWTGRLEELASTGERLRQLSVAMDKPALAVFADEIVCRADMFAGRSRASYEKARRAAELYDEVRDRRLAFVYGRDPGIQALCIAGYQAWNAGRVDEAIASADRCVVVGRNVGHPFSLCFALAWSGTDLGYFIRDAGRVAESSRELIEVAERYGFGFHAAFGRYYCGWILATEGRSTEGLDLMRDSLKEMIALGTREIFVPRFTAQLAAAYGAAGRPDEGLDILASSPDRAPGGTPSSFAEIFRMEADLLRSGPRADLERAETLYRKAIRQAVVDEQTMWELRASNHLCHLLVESGRADEAMSILRPLLESIVPSARSPDLADSYALMRAVERAEGGQPAGTALSRSAWLEGPPGILVGDRRP